MNTRFFFVFLMIVLTLIAAACTPVIADSAGPALIAIPPAEDEVSVYVPGSGGAEAESLREPEGPRLWSGEVFLSEDGTPDRRFDAVPAAQSSCMSLDDLIRRHGGCVE